MLTCMMTLPLALNLIGDPSEKLEYVFLTINKPNDNNRIYDMECVENIFKQKRLYGVPYGDNVVA